MKTFHPIVIKEFTPLTELEMKKVFGGSGETGSGVQVCRTENAQCTKVFTYKPADDNSPSESDKVPGKCVTASGTFGGDKGYVCTCSTSGVANPNYSGTVTTSHDCASI